VPSGKAARLPLSLPVEFAKIAGAGAVAAVAVHAAAHLLLKLETGLWDLAIAGCSGHEGWGDL